MNSNIHRSILVALLLLMINLPQVLAAAIPSGIHSTDGVSIVVNTLGEISSVTISGSDDWLGANHIFYQGVDLHGDTDYCYGSWQDTVGSGSYYTIRNCSFHFSWDGSAFTGVYSWSYEQRSGSIFHSGSGGGPFTASTPKFILTVNSSGLSDVTITGVPSEYGGTTNYTRSGIEYGTSIILTAPANSGFVNWSGCNSSSGSSCTVDMTSNKTVTANYLYYDLTVNSTGASSVTISAEPSVYGGTTNYIKTGIAAGTSIVLTVPANAGFVNWSGCDSSSGNTCTVDMTSNKTVAANYVLSNYTLAVNSIGASSVVINGEPSIYSGTTDYVKTGIATGTSIVLTVPANAGFVNWSGCDSSSGNTCSLSMTTDKKVIVNMQSTIAAGGNHSLAAKNNGTVWAWGKNLSGQLGDGTTVDRYIPVQGTGLNNVVTVAAGNSHSLSIKNDGTVWAWGDNYYGQLGDGTTTAHHAPLQVIGLDNVKAVAAGCIHSLAMKNDGTVWAWGDNGSGRLGDGTTTDRKAPVKVTGLNNVKAIAAGCYHSLAVKNDGTVWAWGDNDRGKLGDGTSVDRYTPVKVTGLSNAEAVAAGVNHSLALKIDGTVWAWGGNYLGQLGDGTTIDRNAPVKVTGLIDVLAVSAGWVHSLIVKNDGTAWAWGDNGSGQLGDGTATDRLAPVQVTGLTNVVAVAADFVHSLALKNDGAVWAWGKNSDGQLGDGTTTDHRMPVQVSGWMTEEPIAAFVGNPTSGQSPLTVRFSDQSTGEISAWNWDFGDDSTSTNRNTTHTYSTSGVYTVKLTVTGPYGSDDENKPAYIFAGLKGDINDDGDVNLTDVLLSLQMLTGQQTATLTLTADVDGDGKDGLPEAIYILQNIIITASNTPPVANAGVDQNAAINALVTLDGSGSSDSDGDLLTYIWVLTPPAGSGAILSDYTAQQPTFTADLSGIYSAQLVVSDGMVSSPSDIVVITVAPLPGTVQSTTGRIWMDRNLGASRVATSATDTEAYGVLYQWGRDTDGHEKRNSPTTSNLSSSDIPGHGSFITVSSEPYDWSTSHNYTLWQGVSGTNNPCPAGFRLPTNTELDAERMSWSSNNSAGAFASPLKLVMAGVRYLDNGALANAGSSGFYWSSTVNGITSTVDPSYAHYIYFSSSNAFMSDGGRAAGCSVRCIKD